MVDRGSFYASLGRQGSAHSTLDGVPFKIASNFRPSPEVISLPLTENPAVSDAFNEEYSYETEEAVLAWSRAREEAIKKARQDEAEKAAKAAAVQNEADSKRKEITGDLKSCSNVQNEHITSDTKSDVGQESTSCELQDNMNKKLQRARPVVPAKPPIPKPAPKPGSILKPIPIQQSKISEGNESTNDKPSVPSSLSTERFDITMFEQEADPFDNIELQTLDDMEELKILLDSSTNLDATQDKSVTKTSTTTQMNITTSETNEEPNVSEGLYELAGPIANSNAWVTFESEGHVSPAQSTDSNTAGNMISSSDSSMSDTGDYVKLASGSILPPHSLDSSTKTTNGVIAQPSTVSPPNVRLQHGNPFGSKLPSHLAESGIFKPVLPPIPKPRQSALNNPSNTDLTSQNNHMTSAMLSTSLSANAIQDVSKTNQSNSPPAQSNSPKPARVAPPPPQPNLNKGSPANNIMSSSVGPSLASSLDNSQENLNKRNSYSRYSMEWHGVSHSPDLSQGQSSSPLPSERSCQSPPQPWNHFRPLPPPPVPTSNDKALPQRPPSQAQAVGLTDPYYSLSKDAQSFVDRVTSMGFLRAKVARAVDKFGQDEKEVLDHLIAVDCLEQKKFAPLYIENALHKCKNDSEKAERFLKMQSQFEELGFTSDKIQDALVKSNMNHDKALDLLTACSP